VLPGHWGCAEPASLRALALGVRFGLEVRAHRREAVLGGSLRAGVRENVEAVFTDAAHHDRPHGFGRHGLSSR